MQNQAEAEANLLQRRSEMSQRANSSQYKPEAPRCALHAAPCMLRPACSMMLVSTAIVHARLTLLLQHGATDTDAGALAHCHQPSDAVARHQQWYARES
jgi:hypothetical protein